LHQESIRPPFCEIAGTTIVTISKLPTAGCRRLTAAGRKVTQACSRQLRSDSGEQYAQLGRLRLAAGPDNGWLVIDVLRLGYGPWCGARGDRWAAASRLAG
jgi:hypothetical protein